MKSCPKHLLILKANLTAPVIKSQSVKVINFSEIKTWIKKGILFKYLFRFETVQLQTAYIDALPKPLITSVILFALTRKKCIWKDEKGNELIVTFKTVTGFLLSFLKNLFKKRKNLKELELEATALSSEVRKNATSQYPLNLNRCPYYLRTDLVFGLQSGGSVGHIAGVLNNLDQFTPKPCFISSDQIPTVRNDLQKEIIRPGELFWDFPDVPSLAFNDPFYEHCLNIIEPENISLIYQRYSTNNFSGVKLAKHFKVPFILEYNGSEIWINRNWGKPLRYEELSLKIEMLNLNSADLIVVVSQVMKDELIERGITKDKILVNPNGVDPNKYSPEIDGSHIRKQYGLLGKTVIGFIGTFGKWHGAEVLVEAFGNFLKTFPDYRSSTRLLLIGDGVMMPVIKEKLAQYNIEDLAILPGIVPQDKGPEYLAACDILASPHIPNSDGSPFFGSPTKLFEYMAMGKGIVASDLAQIGDILAHDKTAWMVEPGDINALASGLKALIDSQELRTRLGKAAREDVVSRFTWKQHTQKIIAKLQELLS